MATTQLKRIVRPFVPVGLIDLYANHHSQRERQQEDARRLRFEGLRGTVGQTIGAIASLTREQCVDLRFLEHEFIPSLGLNDELLHEQPAEFAASQGKGLHIWQYPVQLAGYLAWLTRNAEGITSYMEIGCRWGGMFILISEWIRRHGDRLRSVTAVDPIEPTPFIETYFALLREQAAAGRTAIEATYLQEFSTAPGVRDMVERTRPDFVFIDGDHRLYGALADHMLIRDHARIIVHHDVFSQSCPDTTLLWDALKTLEAHTFENVEFVGQYPSVNGHFLGIGALKRRQGA